MCRRIFAQGHKQATVDHIVKTIQASNCCLQTQNENSYVGLSSQSLINDGLLHVSRAVASEVLMGFRASFVRPATPQWHIPVPVAAQASAEAESTSPPFAHVCYEALMRLEREDSLDFRVADVVREMVELLDDGTVE